MFVVLPAYFEVAFRKEKVVSKAYQEVLDWNWQLHTFQIRKGFFLLVGIVSF